MQIAERVTNRAVVFVKSLCPLCLQHHKLYHARIANGSSWVFGSTHATNGTGWALDMYGCSMKWENESIELDLQLSLVYQQPPDPSFGTVCIPRTECRPECRAGMRPPICSNRFQRSGITRWGTSATPRAYEHAGVNDRWGSGDEGSASFRVVEIHKELYRFDGQILIVLFLVFVFVIQMLGPSCSGDFFLTGRQTIKRTWNSL